MKIYATTAFAIIAGKLALAAPLEARMDNIINIDDASKDITYNGKWTHATNQEDRGVHDHMNTESYSNDPVASYSVLRNNYVYMTIYAGKKIDRGAFDVYVDGAYLGSGDAHSNTCKAKCPTEAIFQASLYDTPITIRANSVITVKNRGFDARLDGKVPYLDIDYISFDPGYPPQ